jgi:uncharacterized protein (DUF1800 family)
MDTYDQPPQAQDPQDASAEASTQPFSGPHEEPTIAITQTTSTPPNLSGTLPVLPNQPTIVQKNTARRRIVGKSLAALVGVGGAAAIGGFALAQWSRHGGGSSNQSHNTANTTIDPNATIAPNAANSLQIGHLLRRAGFGATASELTVYRNLGFEGAVDRLLNYQQVDDSDMEKRLQALNLDLSAPRDQQRWWLLRMAWTQRPLLEKMTLFWHGVLTSSYHKVGGARVFERMIVQNKFLRAHAFDTFDTLLLGITTDPAMLVYLDLTRSTRKHPNENYARELMELFTVGLGKYTQDDVSAASSALTGWHARGLDSFYNPNTHNTQPVTFMGQTGSFDYKDIVRILANHPATPWFIGRRLFAFFAYENPSQSDLQPLVDAYVKSGHNMGAVMRVLLLSPQFSGNQAYRSRIKSPVEFTIGAYRALGGQNDGLGLPLITTLMGQTLFNPPNVAGWLGDKNSSNWLNSGTWITRLNYLDILLARGNGGGRASQPLIDLQGMINTNQLSTPEQFVDHFASFLLDGPLPDERRSQVLNYFTASGNAGRQQIALSGGKSYPLNQVRGALYLIMASPEYQLN